MRRLSTGRLSLALLTLAALHGVHPPPAFAGHPAYERLLIQGTLELQQGRAADAARTLEVAAFGLLDDPPRRAEALTRLGLAQAALEDDEGFLLTVGRLDEVVSRFDAWQQAGLDPGERQAFRAQAARLLPEERRAELPWLTPPQVVVEPADSSPTAGETSVGEPSTVEPSALAAAPLTAEEQRAVARARSILSEAQRARELDEALELACRVADAHPERRNLQHLAAEIAYRSSRWGVAVTYFERGGPPASDAPELGFYLAVALYETGRLDEARRRLEAVLPLLERTEFVERYRRRILSGDDES